MCSFPVIYLGPNYGGGNNNNGNLLQKVPCTHCYTQCPQSCSRPQLTHTSTRDTHRQIWSVSCGVTAPFSWVLVHKRFCLCPARVCFLVLSKFWPLYGGVNGNLSLVKGLCHTQVYYTQSPSPAAVHCWHIPPQETLKHSSVSVSVGSLDPGMHKVCLNPLSISKMDRPWWKVLTKYHPLEKGMANHFSILALRTPWTVWKGKKIGHWKMNSPGG